MKYRPLIEKKEEDGYWSEWVSPKADYKLRCCDCSLVHNIQFKVVKVKEKLGNDEFIARDLSKPGNYLVMFRAQRNNRATSQCRRKDKMKKPMKESKKKEKSEKRKGC